LCLANPIIFCEDMTGNVDKGGTGVVMLLDSNKSLNSISKESYLEAGDIQAR